MCHLPEDLISRLLTAAHSAPSVGLMQLSRFIVIRDPAIRSDVYGVFERANVQAAASYAGGRREQYADLKLEGILEAPQNLCVLCDSGSGRGHGLGRQTMPETALYSTVCAIHNLWLAARSEGVVVGWVSILDPEKLREVLHPGSPDARCLPLSPLRQWLRLGARSRTSWMGAARAGRSARPDH